jgi:hypothetical protein
VMVFGQFFLSKTAKLCFVASSESLNLNSGAEGVLQGVAHDLLDAGNQFVGPVKMLGHWESVNSIADVVLGIWGKKR